MATRSINVDEKVLADLHTLRQKLEEVVLLLRALTTAGIQLKFSFGLNKDGLQDLVLFEPLVPFNINQ